MSGVSALRIEIQRQCAIGAGTFSVDDGYGASGLWQISADLDAVGLRKALSADATLSHHTAPSGGEVGPGVVERMIALVRGLAAADGLGASKEMEAEARVIVTLLPEPVDPDEVEAQKLNDDSPYDLTGLDAEHASRNVRYIQATILAAIKRGRQLATHRSGGE